MIAIIFFINIGIILYLALKGLEIKKPGFIRRIIFRIIIFGIYFCTVIYICIAFAVTLLITRYGAQTENLVKAIDLIEEYKEKITHTQILFQILEITKKIPHLSVLFYRQIGPIITESQRLMII